MKFLVIGLGSMGKRRIRCLKKLGFNNIVGFDIEYNRRKESEQKYSIKTISSIDKINLQEFSALIISVPPDVHLEYTKLAIDNNIPAFVEAGVILDHSRQILEYLGQKKILIAPSCTLKFHPIIKDMKNIIKSNVYGSLSNFIFHSGQYLPDWHPWEKVSNYYVSNRETGGAREIVPFELTWITDIFGYPIDIKGYFRKTMDIGADIEDTYSFVLKFEQGVGSMLVDVVSRFATRSIIINLEKAQIRWNWEEKFLRLYEADRNRWIYYNQPEGKSEIGYNTNIIEEMYVEEIKSFIDAINNKSIFPNSLLKDVKVLELLEEIENSDGGF